MVFLKNTWYVAANAFELDGGLVSRTICNEPIVMFRTAAGAVAALQDRCPHRFVPLSMGRRVGDSLQCGYHGLRFASDGSCAEMPNDPESAVRKPCVRVYPAVERHGVVWLWMGRGDRADPGKIPDYSFITDKRYATAQGLLHVKANYQLIADNLLDLSHVHYLHPEIELGGDFKRFKNEVRVEGDTIWSMLWRPDLSFDEGRRKQFGFTSDTIDGQGHSRWDAPGSILVLTAWWERGKSAEEGVQSPSAHLITPETELTSHYFWATGRTFDIQNVAANQAKAALVQRIFSTQDAPMIEAQQVAMGETTDFLEQKPIILKADAAGVAARRLLKRKIAQESQDGASGPPVAAE